MDRFTGQSLLALAVEDSVSERERLKALLVRQGVNTIGIADGASALRSLNRADFDIVLCDWELPGISGLEICRAVQSLPMEKRPYFIMVTGRVQRVDLVAAMDAGADDFIRKPLWKEELRVRLRLAKQIIAWRRVVNQAGLTSTLVLPTQ